MAKKSKPLVSVIVPAYNEERVIGRLLSSILKQTYKNTEIIVVDDASIDSTAKIAKKFTNKVFKRRHAERSVQRNFGAKKARGKHLFFLDADMKLAKDVVRNCVDLMTGDKKVGAIAIKERPMAKTFWEKAKAYERSFYNLEGDEVTDAARFFTKEVFWEIGGYDEAITGPEDWDITDKVRAYGYRIGWAESIIYHYERVPNPIKLAKKKFYYGLKSHRYLSKHKISAFSPKTVYFLRPVFYKNFGRVIRHPLMSFAMFVILTFEMVGGGLGYLVGRIYYAR